MAKFQIFSDSCCDLSLEDRERYHIDYCKMNIVVDGEEKPADLDWGDFKPEEFYGWLASGRHLKTTQVPISEYINCLTPYLEKGIDILYIACSSKLSGSINVFSLARDQLLEQFPERTIIGIDSTNASFAEGILTIIAAQKRDEGATIEEVAEFIEQEKVHMMQFATVETLSYIKAAGRIKASKAVMGNLFHKKPIFISDRNGDNYTLGTVTGTKNADAELLKGAIERLQLEKFKVVYIGQGMAQERAERLKEKLLEAFDDIEVRIRWIGPIIGTTCGPGVIAVFGYGKEVTCFDGDGNKPSLDYSQI